MTLSITTLCHFAKCNNAECPVLFIIMLNVVMLSVFMLSVFMLCVIILRVVAPKVTTSDEHLKLFGLASLTKEKYLHMCAKIQPWWAFIVRVRLYE